ncbi:MAG: LptF/LptG family permease [Gemmatimonadota bacterium]
MRLLDRYFIRHLLPPLAFAFMALTSIMLLNQVAKRFGDLVGKGLPWSVIGEVFALCIPFIVAMTLPMAVLVAILYAYSHLASDNELTAMRASGVSLWQMLRPALVVGFLFTIINFGFTDQILPVSNARLRNLLLNIQRKKPTFELREQVINEIPPSGLFLRASRIEATTGRLRNVTIYDMAATEGRRIIYADSGHMAFTSTATDLDLLLFDGAIHAYKSSDPTLMQVTYFRKNNIKVKDVSNRLELDNSDGSRGDREMSSCEMMNVVWEADREELQATLRRAELTTQDLRRLLGLTGTVPRQIVPPVVVHGYCQWFERAGQMLLPKKAAAQEPGTAQQPGTPGAAQQPVQATPLTGRLQAIRDSVAHARHRRDSLKNAYAPIPPVRTVPGDSIPRRALGTEPKAADIAGDTLAPTAALQRVRAKPTALSDWGEASSVREETTSAALRGDNYEIEVHKKWAISVACLVFVIAGVPMALRFPRGGMGLVIGGGLAVFSIYYVGLIAGEGLGNKGILSPALAMWGPNIIMMVFGLIGLWRVSRESGSTRGGDLADLRDMLVGRIMAWRRR